MNPPKISVIIPLFNAERFLERAVASVFEQKIAVFEIWIVDDGSTDDSLAVARKLAAKHPEIRVLSQPNRGPSSARNAGLREMGGEIIFFLDADDEVAPGAWQFLLTELEKTRALYGDEIVIRGELHPLLPQNDRWELSGQPGDFMVLGTNIYTRRVFEVVGYFDEDLWASEDIDWLVRAQELKIQMPLHKRITLHYRRHDTNITLNTSLAKSSRLLMFKKRLDRQRAKQKASA